VPKQAGLGVKLDMVEVEKAHYLNLAHGLCARDDAAAMQIFGAQLEVQPQNALHGALIQAASPDNGNSGQGVALGHARGNKGKGKTQGLGHRLLNSVPLVLGKVKHHVHIVTHVAGGQAIQGNTCHVSKHVRGEIRIAHRHTRHIFKHQALIVVMYLLEIKNHVNLQ
jgi:hypothetical protein